MAENPDKVFDVAKPGKTAADPSAKPIVVTNKPELKDPMVKEKESDSFPAQDMDDSKKVEQETQESDDTKIAAPKVKIEPIKDEDKTDAEKEATKEQEKKDKDSDNEKAVIGAIVDQASEKRKGEIEDQETKKRKKEVNNLIESKKYFVPIGEKSRRRKTRNLLIVLVLVLIFSLATFNFLLDAELIESNFKPYTDLFK